ncbi:37S ribosomal protein mrp4, mitochondrial [Hypsizygus marmoreus]|uniref:37S ribosomal protein mrp4, mitochondrial n=1 Tax=Hypsizygus marmoreus TaxID=39966 RepID=A0A369JUJ1_HYPMA|nr:37S ribosomal protein mrp4, mitochondrial [Hypsizygus marmoreus]
MSLQSTVRPWLAASASCSSTSLKRNVVKKSIRCLSTADNSPLETPTDWTNFQLRRAQVKSLIESFSEYGSTQNSENTFQPRHGLHKPASHATVSALLAAGAHFGHATSRMNPNFMPYAYGTRAGITIIDVDQTLPMLRRAANLVRAVAHADGQIIFVGTRPDLRPVVEKAAERVGSQAYHVGERWLPGSLTNKTQMYGLDVVKSTRIVPDLVILLNPLANMNAIRECAIEHVPTIGIVDSNVDPRIVMYPIPANDESTRTAELIAGLLSIAGREGAALRMIEEQKRVERDQQRDQHRKRNNPHYNN